MSLSVAEFKALNAFMRDIDKPTTIDELNEFLRKTLRVFRIDHVLCISAFGMPALQDRKPMFGFRLTNWVVHYRQHRYHQDDALPQQAMRLKNGGPPFWWTDFVRDHKLSDLQNRIFEEAFSFGLKEGVVIPIHVRTDDETGEVKEYAFASLGGDIEKSDELENSLRLVMIAAHNTARKILMSISKQSGGKYVDDPIISFSPNVQFNSLRERELETIRQFVDKDTLEEIADAMDIKVSTVKTHLKNARETLGFSSNKEMMVALMRHNELI